MLGVGSLARAFERHAHRRAAGKPTPVVLVGPAVVDAWAHAHARVVRAAASDVEEISARYLAQLAPTLVPRIEGTDFERTIARRATSEALLAAGDLDRHVLLHHGDAPARAFAAASRILGTDAPALLLEAELDAAVRSAIALSEAAPDLPIAIAASQPDWERWLSLPGREHAKAVLEVCILDDRSATPRTKDEDDAARSAAERALFEALEGHPMSKGLFALNRTLDVLFGSRPLEIDLACASLRLAIEVDGYYHFEDADAYRRDRRKDLALQRNGYFVHRVLAEDVMKDVTEVVIGIHASIAHLKDSQ